MTKKKLNIEGIANELEGASLFFKRSASPLPTSFPATERPLAKKVENPLADSPFFEKSDTPLSQVQKEEIQDQKRTNVQTDVRTDVRTFERPDVPKKQKPKRRKIRHAFDIYQDQLLSLQMRQLEAVQRGRRKPKLGKMVQDAIDLYLKQSGSNKK